MYWRTIMEKAQELRWPEESHPDGGGPWPQRDEARNLIQRAADQLIGPLSVMSDQELKNKRLRELRRLAPGVSWASAQFPAGLGRQVTLARWPVSPSRPISGISTRATPASDVLGAARFPLSQPVLANRAPFHVRSRRVAGDHPRRLPAARWLDLGALSGS